MIKYYVYLNLKENRLIMTQSEIPVGNFQLMMTEGYNHQILSTSCKTFCLGYLYGSQSKRKLVNDPNEFV